VDRVLQYQQQHEIDDTVQQMQAETEYKRQALLTKYQDVPTLLRCVVRHEYKMGGSHGLSTKVQLGQVLEVLQEGVGPGQAYNVCRVRDAETGQVVSVGWYPMAFLEPIVEKEEKKENNDTKFTKIRRWLWRW